MSKCKVFVVSLAAGFVLGLFLKWAQFLTGITVYTLLLNVDYLPVLGQFTFSEPVEFIMHLVIAVLIGFILDWGIRRFHLSLSQTIFTGLMMNLLIAICYFPVTLLSAKTPDITSVAAWGIWLFAHAIYGFLLSSALFSLYFEKAEKSV